MSSIESRSPFRARALALGLLFGGFGVACSEDAPVGTPASLSVGGGGTGGSQAAGAGGDLQAGGQAGTDASNGGGGSGPIATGGAAGSSSQAGTGGTGQAGSGQAGANAGGSDAGEDLPVGGPLYHVSCLPSLAGNDPSKALRFAGKILALSGGQRFAYLRALPVGATALSEAFGPVQLGKSAGPAIDGDPVSFGKVEIPGKANPISGSDLVISPAQLRLVLAGPENRPCAELDGKIVKPLELDLSGSVDTCLFDPVASDTTPTPAVTNAARFVPCTASPLGGGRHVRRFARAGGRIFSRSARSARARGTSPAVCGRARAPL